MSGMYIRNCHVNFDGQPSLIANNSTPYSGGGIHADGTTAIASYVPVHFVNNTARDVCMYICTYVCMYVCMYV